MDICTVRFRYPTSEAGTMTRREPSRSLVQQTCATHIMWFATRKCSCKSSPHARRELGRQTRWFQLNRRARHRCVVVCTKLDASCTHNPEQQQRERLRLREPPPRERRFFLDPAAHGPWLRPRQGRQLLLEAATPSAAAPGSSPARGNATGWCSLKPAQRDDQQRLLQSWC